MRLAGKNKREKIEASGLLLGAKLIKNVINLSKC